MRNRRSLSARRAWIEIFSHRLIHHLSTVALRKESVDRNNAMQVKIVKMHASLSARRAWIEMTEVGGSNQTIIRSLSARRAWIEIFVPFDVIRPAIVALRKESVDRNASPVLNA